MAQVTAQAIRALVLRTGQEMAPPQNSGALKKTAVRIMILILTAVCLGPLNPFMGIPYAQAQEKDTILPGSGIVYPSGYDLNTVGNIKGKVSGIVIPDSGPVQLSLIVGKETYTVLTSPGWYWKDMDAGIREGAEVSVRGSKSMGKDGRLYIIAQEITITGSKKTLALRNESGKALWGSSSQKGLSDTNQGGFGSQSGGSGSSSGGSGSSSRGRSSGGSSGKGRGGR